MNYEFGVTNDELLRFAQLRIVSLELTIYKFKNSFCNS